MSDTPSENLENNEQSTVGKTPLRVRSRFPKAMPNVAISSGIARIRRLSGHYSSPTSSSISSHLGLPTSSTSNQDEVYNTVIECRTPPPRSLTPSSTTVQQTTLSRQLQLIDQVLSPKVTNLNEAHGSPHSPSIHMIKEREGPGVLHSHTSPLKHVNDENSSKSIKLIKSNLDGLASNSNIASIMPSTPPQSSHSSQAIGLKQFINSSNSNAINNKINSPYATSISSLSSHFYHQPQTPTMFHNTPCGSVYNPQFSKEHIMNIIKHKALQKLKKIESESLKERRKKYKRDMNLSINKVDILPINQDSNESTSSDQQKDPNASSSSIDRSKIRMRDLLYYSSRSGMSKKPVVVDQNEVVVEACTNNDEIILETIEPVKEPSPPPVQSIPKPKTTAIAAPQLKFAEDGSIILNEESLVIQREHHEPVYESTIVESEQNDNLTYNSYRKFHHTKKWTERETAKFYKALSMIGTDFTMIQRLFTNRNRDEIKRKFKREEKLNQALIDKILSKTAEIDLSVFVSDSSDNEETKRATLKNKGKNSSENGDQTSDKRETEKMVIASDKSNKKKKNNSNTNGETVLGESGENLKSTQKKKLKRIEKRAFVDSESDSENKTKGDNNGKLTKSTQSLPESSNNVNVNEPANKKYKSKKLIIDDDYEEEITSNKPENRKSESPNLLPVYQIEMSDLARTKASSPISLNTVSALKAVTSANEINSVLPPVSTIFSNTSNALISSRINLSNESSGNLMQNSRIESIKAIEIIEVPGERKKDTESATTISSSESVSSSSSSSSSSSVCTKSTGSNSVSEEEDDEEGIELVFDMDNNSIKEIKNLSENPVVKNEEQINLIQDTENSLNNMLFRNEQDNKSHGIFNASKINQENSEEEEENVIFDLDNNKVIKNENIIDMNIPFNTPTNSKSKITITKIVKK